MLILSRPTKSIVTLLLWRKFICDKSASGMSINPQIVLTFMPRVEKYPLQFISSLACGRTNISIILHSPTSLISHQFINPENLKALTSFLTIKIEKKYNSQTAVETISRLHIGIRMIVKYLMTRRNQKKRSNFPNW